MKTKVFLLSCITLIVAVCSAKAQVTKTIDFGCKRQEDRHERNYGRLLYQVRKRKQRHRKLYLLQQTWRITVFCNKGRTEQRNGGLDS